VKRYSVSLRAVVTREVEIEAETPEEAVKIIKERGKQDVAPMVPVHFEPESLAEVLTGEDGDTFEGDCWFVTGACEACSVVLFETSDFVSDENGVDLCRPCAAKCVEDAAGESDPSPETTSGEASVTADVPLPVTPTVEGEAVQ
jgi:hypothetical protein